jgi:uncharacterized protein with PQ loop repeat
MPEMNLRYIDQISSDIRQQKISFSHLAEDLIDHVCCDVESEMQRGLNFSEAYLKVKTKIGLRGLKEIQEETLYAVDTKYRKMKNIMKISGITGTVMLGFAAAFKIFHFPGTSILMTVGSLVLAFIFMPSALVVLWKETHSGKRLFLFISAFLTGATFILGILLKTQHLPAADILLSFSVLSAILLFLPTLLFSKLADNENINKRPLFIVAFIAMILYLVSFWFKMQHWPLATILMTLGSLILMVAVLPWYTWISWKGEEQVSSKFIFIVITIALFVMPGALVSLSVQQTYNEEFFVHQDQQRSIMNYRQNSNEKLLAAYKDSVQYNKMEQIHLKTTDLISQIDRIERKMIDLSEESPSAENPSTLVGSVKGNEIQYRYLKNPYNKYIVKFKLFPAAASRVEFDKSVMSYINFISENTSAEFSKSYEPVLNPSTYLPDENSYIGENILISGLHALMLFRNGVLLTENEAFKQILKH